VNAPAPALPYSLPELRSRMLRVLAVNRTAALNFPGLFMGLAGEVQPDATLRLRFDDVTWARDSGGELNLPALGVLVDTVLGSVTRHQTGPTARPITAQLAIQFTGAPMTNRIGAHARFLGFAERVPGRQSFASCAVSSGDTVVAHASGAFVNVSLAPDATQATLPWQADALDGVEPLRVGSLEAHERAVVRRFDAAHRAATPAAPFVEHFWCGLPTVSPGRARLTVPVAPHLGNRVGQVHGGMLFGLAAKVARAAVPGMRLHNLTAWFLAPGSGPRLRVRSTVVQQGRTLALVRTEILNAEGRRVLEAATQHVASGC
jgi:acyl-coenzyme A thioesterase PaaI-like protein